MPEITLKKPPKQAELTTGPMKWPFPSLDDNSVAHNNYKAPCHQIDDLF